MPLYEYQCPQCRERVELLRNFSDAAAADCPKCGTEMKKLMSAPAIQFKGSGFYKTDYAAGTKSASTGSDSSSAPSGSTPAASTGSSSESKSEKSETKSSSTPATTSSSAD